MFYTIWLDMTECNQNNLIFSVGDFVFAKLKGFSYWPAIVEDVLNTHNVPTYNVQFLCDSSTATIEQTALSLFTKLVVWTTKN